MSSSFEFDVYLYTSTQFKNVRILLISSNSVQIVFRVNGVEKKIEVKFFSESVGTCTVAKFVESTLRVVRFVMKIQIRQNLILNNK